jgi:hypothetical protein
MTDFNPSKSALYQRQLRLKIKEQKEKQQDLIDRQIIEASKKQKIIEKTHKNNDWDFEGREPQANLVKQYPEQKDEYNYNFWGYGSSTQPTVNPLNKISHQQNLKALFGSRAE